MRNTLISVLVLGFICVPAFAQDAGSAGSTAITAITTPTEVGNTSMPPGQYVITEQISNKSYNLTVSSKGTMILAPATAAAPAGTAAAATAPGAAGNTMMKNLMHQGMEKGATELMKMETKGTLNNFLGK